MSDNARQSFTDKVGASAKPNSEKTVFEQASDSTKGTLDSAASTLQPNSQKSHTQRAGDSLTSNSNENQDSLLGKAKNAVGLGESK